MFKHKTEERTYVIMERYTDPAALDAHGKSAHFQKLFGTLGGILDGAPTLHMLDAVE
jgi:quinol monooxygenase YgiN